MIVMMHIPRLVEHLSHLRGSAARANPYQLYSYAVCLGEDRVTESLRGAPVSKLNACSCNA